jgi:hypothetical protein
MPGVRGSSETDDSSTRNYQDRVGATAEIRKVNSQPPAVSAVRPAALRLSLREAFSKGARSGARLVLSGECSKAAPRYTSPLEWPTRPDHLRFGSAEEQSNNLAASCVELQTPLARLRRIAGRPNIVKEDYTSPVEICFTAT